MFTPDHNEKASLIHKEREASAMEVFEYVFSHMELPENWQMATPCDAEKSSMNAASPHMDIIREFSLESTNGAFPSLDSGQLWIRFDMRSGKVVDLRLDIGNKPFPCTICGNDVASGIKDIHFIPLAH